MLMCDVRWDGTHKKQDEGCDGALHMQRTQVKKCYLIYIYIYICNAYKYIVNVFDKIYQSDSLSSSASPSASMMMNRSWKESVFSSLLSSCCGSSSSSSFSSASTAAKISAKIAL